MLCIVEIAIMIWGITTLVKGEIKFSKNRVVSGMPAYVIGILLAGALPLVFVIAMIAGFMIAINGGQVQDAQALWIVDPIVLVAVGIICAFIGSIYGRDPAMSATSPDLFNAPPSNPPQTNYPPADPSNPYSSPISEDKPRE